MAVEVHTASELGVKHVSAFAPTSSPELDSLLSDFRSKVFLPAHLLKPHRNLIYQPRNHARLRSEPVHVEIGQERVQLEPINRLQDEPSFRKSLPRILSLMREPSDWRVVPAFLAELQTAKRKVTPGQAQKIVRKANEAGRQDIVIECVKRVSKTGLRLNDVHLAREVIWGSYMRAMRAEWAASEVAKAFSQAEYIVDLFEDERHGGGWMVRREDARADPGIIGVLLALSASQARRGQSADGDETGTGTGTGTGIGKEKVETYAHRLRAAWSNLPSSDEAAAATTTKGTWQDANARLQILTPILRGLTGATEILDEDGDVGPWVAETALPQLQEQVQAAAARLEDHNDKTDADRVPRGLAWLRDLDR
ncbi:MAG: hypothetical protein M1838_004735 [Thelocarpon superellum]|nr:MAG: hypothetical protein M1838_004735 [Thelocarpon superellum]